MAGVDYFDDRMSTDIYWASCLAQGRRGEIPYPIDIDRNLVVELLGIGVAIRLAIKSGEQQCPPWDEFHCEVGWFRRPHMQAEVSCCKTPKNIKEWRTTKILIGTWIFDTKLTPTTLKSIVKGRLPLP
jgi:hypothetical protein